MLLLLLILLLILLLECESNDQHDRIVHHHHELVKKHKIAKIENNYHTGNLTIIPPHSMDETYNLRFPTGLNKHGGWAQANQVTFKHYHLIIYCYQ